MECRTFKVKLHTEEKKDNILLAIHCPYEVFYLSVKDSVLKDIPDDEKCKYFITESDFYNGDDYIVNDCYLSSLDDIFKAKDFKEYCYVCSRISMDKEPKIHCKGSFLEDFSELINDNDQKEDYFNEEI